MLLPLYKVKFLHFPIQFYVNVQITNILYELDAQDFDAQDFDSLSLANIRMFCDSAFFLSDLK